MQQESENKDANLGEGYERPMFERHSLQVITLGGTPGSGDSGAVSTQNVFGTRDDDAEEEKFEYDP
ncbi:MAG: hypothetical protein AAGJ52_10075 [Pseudomonadota bacterium]